MSVPPDVQALDRADPLASFRDRFVLPDGVIYLDGNSLGALPRDTPGRVMKTVAEQWGQSLIRAWNDHHWIDMTTRIGDKIARLIGGAGGTTLVADSTSVNLFKLLAAALAMRPDRRTILTASGDFPTDGYIAAGLADWLGQGHRLLRADEPVAALDDDTAVLLLTHVNYRTGGMYDMAAATRAAHAAGALVLWDLSHSAGAVPVALDASGADFAVGCGYKYLNGGPGAPAFLYVAPRHRDSFRQPIMGWLGHASPFEFADDYRPAEGVARATVGTPPIISLAALEVGVDLMLEAPIALLREKSLRLSALFADIVGGRLERITPLDDCQRGSQMSFSHADGYAIIQALIDRGVIGDFRAPDVLRFGFAPLYLRFADVAQAASALVDILETGAWRDPRFAERKPVT